MNKSDGKVCAHTLSSASLRHHHHHHRYCRCRLRPQCMFIWFLKEHVLLLCFSVSSFLPSFRRWWFLFFLHSFVLLLLFSLYKTSRYAWVQFVFVCIKNIYIFPITLRRMYSSLYYMYILINIAKRIWKLDFDAVTNIASELRAIYCYSIYMLVLSIYTYHRNVHAAKLVVFRKFIPIRCTQITVYLWSTEFIHFMDFWDIHVTIRFI